MYIGWTSEILIILNASSSVTEDQNPDGPQVDETMIAAEMDKAFLTPAGNNIVNNKRFAGFSKVFDALLHLGFVNVQPMEQLQPGAAPITWRELSLMLQPDLTTYDL